MLNAFHKNNMLFLFRKKETFHYERTEVYKLKATMDRELVESGAILGGCHVINAKSEALEAFLKCADKL